jgi:hypothetical protein
VVASHATIDTCTAKVTTLRIIPNLLLNLLIKMFVSTINLSAVFSVIAFLSSGTAARNCQNSPGVANGECVYYYPDEFFNKPIGSYKPDCSGACFVYDSFAGLGIAGDGTYGMLSQVSVKHT